MGGRPKDPDYWRKWRAAHPVYRDREKERRRLAHRLIAAERICREEEPPQSHPILEEAMRIVGPLHATRGRAYKFPSEVLYEELVATAALALIEGVDACAAVDAVRKREACWLRITTWLADEDGKGRLDDTDQRMS